MSDKEKASEVLDQKNDDAGDGVLEDGNVIGDGAKEVESDIPEANSSDGDWDKQRQFRDELSAANKRQLQAEQHIKELTDKADAAQSQLEEIKRENANNDDPDLDEYDDMQKHVKNMTSKLSDLEGQVVDSRTKAIEAQSQLTELQNQIIDREARAEGTRLLNQEIKNNEKRLGTTKHTNKILDLVNKEYDDNQIHLMPDKPRKAWIQNTLKLRFTEAAEKAGSSTAKTKNANAPVDTGSGGSGPPDAEITEGNINDVVAQMKAKYEGG